MAGLLTPGYTCKFKTFKTGTVFLAEHLCGLATQAWATHPVMDVSTSCTSGTISVRVLSCRDSERSVLPLCGKSRVDAVSTGPRAAASCAP